MSKPPIKSKPVTSGTKPAVLDFVNPDSERFTPLNFRVSKEFHREFKLFAVQNGMSMVELLEKSFALMKQSKR